MVNRCPFLHVAQESRRQPLAPDHVRQYATTQLNTHAREDIMGEARGPVEKFYELFAAGKIVDTTALFDPSCVTLMPGGALNQVEHEAMGQAFKAAFPNSYMSVDKIVESDGEVVVLGHFRGTHSGDLQSAAGTIPASGNELNLRFIDYFKVDGERIIDHQTIFDQMELLGQVDALPPG
jgi:predicted ester cyclase